MVTARIPVENLKGVTVSGGTAVFSGYYVTIPIKFFTYEAMPDCTDASKAALRAKVAATAGLSPADAASVTISCRLSSPSAGEAILRRVLRAWQGLWADDATRARLLQDSTAPAEKVTVYLTTPTSVNPATAANTICAGLEGASGLASSDCLPDQHSAATRVQVTASQKGNQAADACDTITANAQQALRSQLGVSSSDVQGIACTATVSDGSNVVTGGNESGTPAEPKKGGLSTGAIIGIAVGGAAGVLIAAVAGVAVTKRARDRRALQFVGANAQTAARNIAAQQKQRPKGSRWMTYSMEVKSERGRAGQGAVAGTTNYA
jgi:hypothetical protein